MPLKTIRGVRSPSFGFRLSKQGVSVGTREYPHQRIVGIVWKLGSWVS